MVDRISKINKDKMVKEIRNNTNMSTQRATPAKTGKDLLAAAREMVGNEFSALKVKNITPQQIDAIARAIVLGVLDDKEKPV